LPRKPRRARVQRFAHARFQRRTIESAAHGEFRAAQDRPQRAQLAFERAHLTHIRRAQIDLRRRAIGNHVRARSACDHARADADAALRTIEAL
jgi:hypothetical protein